MSRIAIAISVGLILLSTQARAAVPDRDARVELATGATLYGIALGAHLAMQTELRLRPAVWLTAALAGGALYGTWKLTEKTGMSLQRARFIESAPLWATTDACLLNLALDGFSDFDEIQWFALGVLTASVAVAALTAPWASVHTGQMTLINSAGVAVPIAGLLLGFTFHLGDGSHIFRDLLVFNLAGIAGAVALTRWYDPTSQQVLYANAGALLGGLSGGLFALILMPGTESVESVSGLAVLGMGVGAGITMHRFGFHRRSSASSPGSASSATSLRDSSATAVLTPVWGASW